ncbi:MAG: glycosyltransferase family 4 protein [Deltaproteobacteria bacterium]|nr:glycosyltransferase family 4 protein [Deltaproteobacteria bacterium]
MKPPKKTRPKILFASFEEIPAPTGSACWATEEIQELARHFDVDVMSLKSEDLSHIERYYGARLLRVPVGSPRFLERVKTFQRALRRQLESEQYRLCHFTSVWEGMVLAARKKADGLRLVYELRSLPSVDFQITHPEDARSVQTSFSLKQQEEHCLAMADRVLVGSEAIRKHLQGRGVELGRTMLLRPSLELAPFESTQSGQPGVLLYLGSLMPWQGVPSILEAAASLPRQIRVRLKMVVPQTEPWFGQLRELAKQYGLLKRTDFIAPVPFEELPSLLSQASICLAPLANHEHNRTAPDTPHKVLVYMAARRPVVAARQPTIKDLVTDGEHGLLFPPGDIAGFSTALRKLLLDRELATRLGNQAALRLEEVLPLHKALAPLRQTYAELLGLETGVSPAPQTATLDTMPGIPQRDDPRTQPDPIPLGQPLSETKPIPMKEIAAEAARELDESGQQPAQDSAGREEFVFRPVDAEDAGEPGGADSWQVMEVSNISLGEPSPSDSADTTPRFLLGGPPFRVSSDETDEPRVLPPTRPLDEEAEMVDDADVQIIDEGSGPKTGSSGSSPG